MRKGNGAHSLHRFEHGDDFGRHLSEIRSVVASDGQGLSEVAASRGRIAEAHPDRAS